MQGDINPGQRVQQLKSAATFVFPGERELVINIKAAKIAICQAGERGRVSTV